MDQSLILEEKDEHVEINGKFFPRYKDFVLVIIGDPIVIGIKINKKVLESLEILNYFCTNTYTNFILQDQVNINIMKTVIKTECLGYNYSFKWTFVPAGCTIDDYIMVGHFATPIFLSRVLTIGKVYEALGK